MNQVVSAESSQNAADVAVKVHGEVLNELPEDLYIPPDALRVFLETFQGPLDLLLYLIRKQNVDILNIPIKEITVQYMKYVEVMQELHLDLAAEYLLMAALLAEIKSRLLLPKPRLDELEEGEDPRAELIRRLQVYEQFKKAADDLSELKHVGRDVFVASVASPPMDLSELQPDVPMQAVLDAFVQVMTRVHLFSDHKVEREFLSTRERMIKVLEAVNNATEFIPFSNLFTLEEGRMGVVVTFMAILELIRQSAIEIVQAEDYAPIYIKSKEPQA